LETLIVFCCYYRADDSSMTGRMEQSYTEALTRYRDYKYPDWQEYIARKMTDWYKAFLLATTEAVVDMDVEAEEVEEGAVVDAPAVVAGGASGAFRMSPPPLPESEGEGCEDGEDGEEPGVRDGDILADGEATEDNVTAAAAAEERLAANATAAAAGP
jgi:hypothetical protein